MAGADCLEVFSEGIHNCLYEYLKQQASTEQLDLIDNVPMPSLPCINLL